VRVYPIQGNWTREQTYAHVGGPDAVVWQSLEAFLLADRALGLDDREPGDSRVIPANEHVLRWFVFGEEWLHLWQLQAPGYG